MKQIIKNKLVIGYEPKQRHPSMNVTCKHSILENLLEIQY